MKHGLLRLPQAQKGGRFNKGGACILNKKKFWCEPVSRGILEIAAMGENVDTLRWVAVTSRFRKLTVLMVEVYLYTGVGFDHRNMLVLQQLATLFIFYNIPFILAGDWNNTWVQLQATGWPNQVDLEVLDAPEVEFTCNRGFRKIDFVVTSPELKPLLEPAEPDFSVPWNPHSVGIAFALRATTSKVMRTVLKVPKELPMEAFKLWREQNPEQEWLPLWERAREKARKYILDNSATYYNNKKVLIVGDLPREWVDGAVKATEDRISLGEKFQHYSTSVEFLVLETLKVPEKDWPKYIGRGAFPKFIEVPAVSSTRLHERYADPNVGFWACLAAKLRELAALLQSPLPGNQTYALMTFCQQQLDKVESHVPGAMSEAYDFQVFRYPLMGMNRGTVSDLAQCADYVQDKLFKTKKAEGRRKFKEFIMEDLLKGGGRLHKYANKLRYQYPTLCTLRVGT